MMLHYSSEQRRVCVRLSSFWQFSPIFLLYEGAVCMLTTEFFESDCLLTFELLLSYRELSQIRNTFFSCIFLQWQKFSFCATIPFKCTSGRNTEEKGSGKFVLALSWKKYGTICKSKSIKNGKSFGSLHKNVWQTRYYMHRKKKVEGSRANPSQRTLG